MSSSRGQLVPLFSTRQQVSLLLALAVICCSTFSIQLFFLQRDTSAVHSAKNASIDFISSLLTNKADTSSGGGWGSKDTARRHTGPQNTYSWGCTNSCACLPPRNQFYFHSSYKTANWSKWPPGWSHFWREWLILHPNTTHILWTDDKNDLLAHCMSSGVEQKYRTRIGIDKVDFSRALYMLHYGGFYHDMDVCPLRNQFDLWKKYNETVLLQGEKQEISVALEYAVTRETDGAFWREFISTANKFGPKGLTIFWKKAKNRHRNVRVLPAEYVTPISWNGKGFPDDHVCYGKLLRQNDSYWSTFKGSLCYHALIDDGAFVFSSYSASWTAWGQKPLH